MARWTFTHFAASQWSSVPSATRADLTGKVVAVIGASSGIGLEAAKHFASMNPKKLVLACRNEERAKRALSELKDSTGFSRAEIQMVDLAQFASVIDFARSFNDKEDRLDILVQNAGVLPEREYSATEGGWEMTLQVNHIALSLLGILLLPKMISTAEQFATHPCMIFLGSEVHLLSKIEKALVEAEHPLKTLSNKEYCTAEVLRKRYNDTKLLNLLFVRALADRLPGSPSSSPTSPTSPTPPSSHPALPGELAPLPPSLIVTCVNPGFCYSDLRNKPNNVQVSSDSKLDGFVNWAREKMFARTAEEGSRQVLFAALLGEPPSAEEGRGANLHAKTKQRKGEESFKEEGDAKKEIEKEGKAARAVSVDKLRGAYISNCEVAEPSDYVLGEEGRDAQEKLWVDLIKELTLLEPQVQEITTRYLADPVNLE